MASGNYRDAGADVVYEPLPAMDSEELGRLRAVIGLPDVDDEPGTPRQRARTIDLSDEPDPASNGLRGSLVDLLEEVDRKLEKLLHAEPSVPNFGVNEALAALHFELDDVRHRVEQIQTSIDALTRSLLGH